jgi:hypothetical protein
MFDGCFYFCCRRHIMIADMSLQSFFVFLFVYLFICFVLLLSNIVLETTNLKRNTS